MLGLYIQTCHSFRVYLNYSDLFPEIQIFFGFEFGEDFSIKVLFWPSNSDSFPYSDFFRTHFIQILCQIKVAGLYISRIIVNTNFALV